MTSVPPPDLLEAASRVRADAYAPYSKFAVGCAVRTSSGRIFVGVNVENASYPVGTCAEAGALAAMIAAGERRLAEVLIVGGAEAPLTPCGACCQRLAEFGSGDLPVHAVHPDGASRRFRLDDLLPYAFRLKTE